MSNGDGKAWYLSKTLWVNIIFLFAFLIKGFFGFEMSAEETAAILVVINLILRVVTKEPLNWS